jgi:hypothetical protein
VRAMAEALATHEFVCGPLEYAELNPTWAVQARGGGPTGLRAVVVEGGPPWAVRPGCQHRRAARGARRCRRLRRGPDLRRGGLRLRLAARRARYAAVSSTRLRSLHYRNAMTSEGSIVRRAPTAPRTSDCKLAGVTCGRCPLPSSTARHACAEDCGGSTTSAREGRSAPGSGTSGGSTGTRWEPTSRRCGAAP